MLKVCFLLTLTLSVAWAEEHPDFSGNWLQANERCVPVPKNKSYVYRSVIRQQGDLLKVDISTTGLREAGELHLTYEVGGNETVYTGLDHDEFHSRAHWAEHSLVFDIEEHEDGKVNLSTEIWTLLDDGKSLKRVKQAKDNDARKSRVFIMEKR